MKTLYLALFSILSLCSYSQGLMTIGEVFDFNVGDKFHYRLPPPNLPPAVDRITITGKFYSDNLDTVFYARYHDSYWTEVNWDTFPPNLIYHFYTETDTVNYTNLDSLISFYDAAFNCDTMYFECDTSIYYSTAYCDRLINGYYVATNDFEPEIYQKEYGQGIGWVWNYYYSSSSLPPGVQWDSKLFYYQKDGIDCGTPDTMTVSTPELESELNLISIYPNPANEFLYISIPDGIGVATFILTDLSGREMLRESLNSRDACKIQVSSFHPGVYLGIVDADSGKKVVKLIIE